MIDSVLSSPSQMSTTSSKSAVKQKGYKLRKNKSAYMFYSADARADYKRKGIKLGPNEMMKAISDSWKSLGKKEKAKYDVIAKQDKERYLREKDELMRIDPSLIVKNKTKKNHIKKPLSAYDFFMKEMYRKMKAANPNLYSADIVKAVSKQWKTLSDDQKVVYQQKANIDKQEKQVLMEELEYQKSLQSTPASTPARSSLNDTEEDEFATPARKHLKLENSPQETVQPLIPSFHILEEPSQEVNNFNPMYASGLPTVSPCHCCTISPSSMSAAMSDAQTGSTTFTPAVSDYSVSPINQMGNLNFSADTTPVVSPPAAGNENLNNQTFESSLKQAEDLPNLNKENSTLNLNKMDSFMDLIKHNSALSLNKADSFLNLLRQNSGLNLNKADTLFKNDGLNNHNHGLSLNKENSFFNLDLSKLPSFCLGLSEKEKEGLSSAFPHH